jgi:putative component of membrane protein insertase Oxa1/YidC/SpoIIIJ protein YidD
MRRTGILFLTLFIGFVLHAQTKKEIGQMRLLFPVENTANPKSKKIVANEYELLLTAAYTVYKTTLSSQDAAHCVFYPSCSEYSLLLLEKEGFVPGIFGVFDRLSRCNLNSREHYTIHLQTGLLYDPVE